MGMGVMLGDVVWSGWVEGGGEGTWWVGDKHTGRGGIRSKCIYGYVHKSKVR